MYIGRWQLGTYVPLTVLTQAANGAAILPDDQVNLVLFDTATYTRQGPYRLPVVDSVNRPGVFTYGLFLTSDFSPGRYIVEFRWNVAGYIGLKADIFDVVEGGNSDGSIVSIDFWNRPEADYVIAILDGGKIIQGRNPVLRTGVQD